METTATTGTTSPLVLAGAKTGYRTFTSAFSTADVVYYCVTSSTGVWEVGYGTFTTSGTTLTRIAGQVLSGSSGAGTLVSLSGTSDVFCTMPSAGLPSLANDNTWAGAQTLGGTISGGGNQINNVVIGTTTPLAGAFTTLSASSTITSTKTAGGVVLDGPNSGTASNWIALTNTGGGNYIGVDNSTGTQFGGTAYGLHTYVPAGRTINHTIDGTGVITTTSTTGLAVTGTLSATGIVSSTATTGQVFNAASATTGSIWSHWQNTSADAYVGIEGSAGGAIAAGTSAYAMVVGSFVNKPVDIISNNAVVGIFSSTGLAVTGTLSATGALGITSYNETVSTPAISGGTFTINLALGSVFSVTLNAAVTSAPTISNVVSSKVNSFILMLTADGTARAFAWPASFKWASGAVPTITVTAGKIDVFTCYTLNNGTSWIAVTSGQNF